MFGPDTGRTGAPPIPASCWQRRSDAHPLPGSTDGRPMQRYDHEQSKGCAVRILQVAPPWLPVSRSAYGGIEWVVSSLADGLIDAGHDVTLLASGGSETRARLETVFDERPSNDWGMRGSRPSGRSPPTAAGGTMTSSMITLQR